MNPQHPMTIVRRLQEAAGYLELGMPTQALESLAAVPDPGPFAAPAALIKGHALSAERRYDEAADRLLVAARLFPEPLARRVWMMISECYRQTGQARLALDSLARARGAQTSTVPPTL